ncbi:ABC transporter ATP-binding protein [Leekyejoonella antrihumi]|uniref:ATP-binding cassette domain-containing protein n=1 Tax=Leekyejoonella antrihumi TaxID=1660198 RepID=A0A563E5P6_9MICO|nr:ATP-binding cassette domain-containing protein [Leekyejoonella antrihumi]TWP37888.1 ATP-binding cassette domain-containing protein [Leekyejoonella antrihumi]
MTTPTFTEIKADKVSCAVGDITMLPPTTFTVRPGENVAITGDNGCGKTTFLRVLTGNLIPTQGVVTRDGTPIDERDGATRRVIAPLIGPVAGFRDMTLADHLILIDQTWGGDREGAGARIADILGKFDILKFGNRFLSELSSGQRQLAELAMVLLRPSGLLVLDEPEQRLDPGRRELLAEVLAERAKQGGAVVWVCHDQALAESSVTRIEHFPQGSRKRSTQRPAPEPSAGPAKSTGPAQGGKKKGSGGQPGRKGNR